MTTDEKLDAILDALGGLTERVSALETAKPAASDDDVDDELARQYARDPDSVCAWCHNYPIVLGEPCSRCHNIAAAHPDAGPSIGEVEILNTPDGVVVSFPEPDEARKDQRRMLERQQLKIALALGDEAGDEDWTERYAEGGPYWLYTHNRDLVITYSPHVLKMMILDVELDSPKLAFEMASDVLKEPAIDPDFETGSGALHVSNLTTAKVKHGQ